jgi:hypothetical protein
VEVEVERLAEEEPKPRGAAGLLRAVGRWEAALETGGTFAPRDEVRLTLPGGLEVRARVLGPTGRGAGVRIRFGTLPDAAARFLAVRSGRALPPAGS